MSDIFKVLIQRNIMIILGVISLNDDRIFIYKLILALHGWGYLRWEWSDDNAPHLVLFYSLMIS